MSKNNNEKDFVEEKQAVKEEPMHRKDINPSAKDQKGNPALKGKVLYKVHVLQSIGVKSYGSDRFKVRRPGWVGVIGATEYARLVPYVATLEKIVYDDNGVLVEK